jgi:hypothetical protein
MLAAIGCIVALICFSVASWPFRLFYILVPAFFLGVVADIHMFHSPFAHGNRQFFTSFEGMKIFLTVPTVYIGGVVLGTILGILRKTSDDLAEYKEKRSDFLRWLVRFGLKWGIPYLGFLTLSQELINHVYGDPNMGWLVTKGLSIYFFIAYVILALVVTSWWKKQRALASPLKDGNEDVEGAKALGDRKQPKPLEAVVGFLLVGLIVYGGYVGLTYMFRSEPSVASQEAESQSATQAVEALVATPAVVASQPTAEEESIEIAAQERPLSDAAKEAIAGGFVEIKDPAVDACTNGKVEAFRKEAGEDAVLRFDVYNEFAVECGFNI